MKEMELKSEGTGSWIFVIPFISSVISSGSDAYSIKNGITSLAKDESTEPIEPTARMANLRSFQNRLLNFCLIYSSSALIHDGLVPPNSPNIERISPTRKPELLSNKIIALSLNECAALANCLISSLVLAYRLLLYRIHQQTS
jgi:hypothetical protein